MKVKSVIKKVQKILNRIKEYIFLNIVVPYKIRKIYNKNAWLFEELKRY